MSGDEKVAATEGLLGELVEARQEADTKAKITPVHILNDVSATMAKINREVRYLLSVTSVHVLTTMLLTARCLECSHRLRSRRHWHQVKCRSLHGTDGILHKQEDPIVFRSHHQETVAGPCNSYRSLLSVWG